MRFVSLKWKLSVSFILLALGFVSIYVVLAKRTFESDKISYIFESQQRQVSGLARNLENQIARVLFDARTILSGYDFPTKQLNPAAQTIFWEHPNLLAIEAGLASSATPAATLEKTPGLLRGARQIQVVSPDEPILRALDNDKYMVALLTKDSKHGDTVLYVVFELKSVLDEASRGQVLALTAGENLLRRSSADGKLDQEIAGLGRKFAASKTESTAIEELGGVKYLVSSARLGIGNLQMLALIEERVAMGALNVLFQRSILFLFFSFFATVVVSLLLSNRLTQNINSLSMTAEKIGHGDFSAQPDFKSNDEVGILAGAFQKMGGEIKRLLDETVDKTRMEAELKTARLVQDSLFPEFPLYQNGNIRLFGTNKTTTECGGDWWFYYQKEHDLYIMVADATGHGIPAALITAAARSLFSHVRDVDEDLKKITSAWDKAVRECSNGKVYMTALVMKMNVETGECRFINAGHEAFVLLRKSDTETFEAEYISGQQNHALGEVKGHWLEDTLQLQPEDRLFLLTDGLLAIPDIKGRPYSERRFLTFLSKTLQTKMPPDQFVQAVDAHFEERRAGQMIPDDVTIVGVDFKAKL